MAVVVLAPSLSWPVFVFALLFTAIGLLAVLKDRPRSSGLAVALMLASVMVVISDEVCQAMPWLIECWCKWCL